MCAPCYAATSSSVATQRNRTFAEVLPFVQWDARIGNLSCFSAPRAEYLICLCFSAAQPPRTSWLLSCHRSVGGLGLAVPAKSFANLRSNKKPDRLSGLRSLASLLQS